MHCEQDLARREQAREREAQQRAAAAASRAAASAGDGAPEAASGAAPGDALLHYICAGHDARCFMHVVYNNGSELAVDSCF